LQIGAVFDRPRIADLPPNCDIFGYFGKSSRIPQSALDK